MSAPTAPMVAPSINHEPVVPSNNDSANNDSAAIDEDTVMTVDEPGQLSSPLSSQSSQETNGKQPTAADDSEAETDIASTNNTPVKSRTRPGFQYSLDSNDTVSKRPAENGLAAQAASALARKRKAEEGEATESRRSRSRSPLPPTTSNINITKKARLSPELTSTRPASAKASDAPTERATRAGTPNDRTASNLLAQARPHLADNSRAKTEPRMRSHSPANAARSSHRRSSSFHTAAAAAAASAERERRARNRQSLESVSNENTPIPGRARHLESTPAHSPMARRDKDSTGRTQLAQACDKGHIEKVKELLSDATKEYINEPDHAATSPVQMAALKGHVEIVKLLIDAGANINGANRFGDTPLIDAVENSHADVVELLLEHGVDPWRANNRGDRPADLVNDDDEEERIRQVLKDACEAWNAKNQGSVENIPRPQVPKTRDLLYVAPNSKNLRDFAEEGYTEGVKYMYKCTVEPNNDCLVAAARGGHVDTVLEMLEYAKSWALPYDPDPELVDGETAMLAAIERGNIGVIRKLLEWDKQGLDARRLIKGKTYFGTLESMSMKPPGWEEGYQLLKEAYEDEERSAGPDPPRRRKLMTGKQRNEEAANKAAEDIRPLDNESATHPIKTEADNDENSKVSDAVETHNRELARVKEQLREKIRVVEERKAKETAKTNLEIQAKAETKAQEEAKQRVVEEKEARAAAAAAKQAKAREAALKIQAEAKAARQAKEAEASAKASRDIKSPAKSPVTKPKSPEKDDKAEKLSKEKEAKAETLRKEAEEVAQRKKAAAEESQRKEAEAQADAHRQEEETKAEARRKEEAAKEESRQKQEEAKRQETARIEEEIARRRAAEKEAQDQADRERYEAEVRAAEEARQKQKAEVARLKAMEEARLKAEAESRLKAEEEARVRAIEERKKYLASLPRALSKALQPEYVVQPEHIVRPHGPQHHLDYVNSLESHWQPVPLFRQSDIIPKGGSPNAVYVPGFIASTYLRHTRLDHVRTELNWDTLPCTPAQRKTLWERAGVSHFLVRDHDWALAPPEARKDCGIDIEIDMLGVPQIDWAELYDEGKKKWLAMDDEQCLWVKWDDLLRATTDKEWLRNVEIRTSAWDCLGDHVRNGVNGTRSR